MKRVNNVAFSINSNRAKFAIRSLVSAGLCGINIANLKEIEEFYALHNDYQKMLFDMRIYPGCTSDEYQEVLSSMHPYAILYYLSSKERISPVNPALSRNKLKLDNDIYRTIANQGSKNYSIYVADTSLAPLIPKDTFVEFKTKESRVSGKLLNLLKVNPDSVIAFNASDCAKTIFTVIENFHCTFCAYWDFPFDVSLNSDFPNRRKVISRSYTHSSKEFIPNPNIGVISYNFTKDDFWQLPNMFSDVRYLVDVDFEYSYREIKPNMTKGPVTDKKKVHKNILTNIADKVPNPVDNVRPFIAYHWFFEELPNATMDIFTNLTNIQVGDEYLNTNLGIIQYYVNAVLNLASATVKQQDNQDDFEDVTTNAQIQLCQNSIEYVFELLNRCDDNYQYLIDTTPAERLFSGLQ